MMHHGHVFIAMEDRYNKEGQVYVWCGKLSNQHERNFAENLVKNQVWRCSYEYYLLTVVQGFQNVTVVDEAKEDESFWAVVGGESIYYDKNPSKRVTPRLFQCIFLALRFCFSNTLFRL